MQNTILPLTIVPSGKELILVSIEGGWGLRRRLADMGLSEGMKFKVLHSHGTGPCVVLVGNTRLALGHGMAHKVLVKMA